MRIQYFHSTNVLIPSANAVQTMRMCESFARHGAAVELLFPCDRRDNVVPLSHCHRYYDVERSFGLRALAAPFSTRLVRAPGYLQAAKLWAYSVECLRAATSTPSTRADVLYTRCATAAASLPWLTRVRPGDRPVVIFEAHEYPRDRLRAAGLAGVDGIVVIARRIADELQSRLRVPPDRILVAPDGVPDSWLQPIDKSDARQRLGLRAERALAVFTGTIHPDVAPMLFDAAAALQARADLVVVGAPSGESRTREERLAGLRAEAQRRNLPMFFAGQVPSERARIFQSAADVLIAPYSGTLRWARYTSPLKLFEYMASGRPIVASELPVLHEILQHDDGVWFVPPADGTAIGEGVVRVLDDADCAARLATRARHAATTYTWDRRAGAVLDFIRDREGAR